MQASAWPNFFNDFIVDDTGLQMTPNGKCRDHTKSMCIRRERTMHYGWKVAIVAFGDTRDVRILSGASYLMDRPMQRHGHISYKTWEGVY